MKALWMQLSYALIAVAFLAGIGLTLGSYQLPQGTILSQTFRDLGTSLAGASIIALVLEVSLQRLFRREIAEASEDGVRSALELSPSALTALRGARGTRDPLEELDLVYRYKLSIATFVGHQVIKAEISGDSYLINTSDNPIVRFEYVAPKTVYRLTGLSEDIRQILRDEEALNELTFEPSIGVKNIRRLPTVTDDISQVELELDRGQRVRFLTKETRFFNHEDDDDVIAARVTSSLRLEAQAPDGFDLDAVGLFTSVIPKGVRTFGRARGTGGTWEVANPLLPGWGVRLNWKRKAKPVTPESATEETGHVT